jgi:hypothetical protein
MKQGLKVRVPKGYLRFGSVPVNFSKPLEPEGFSKDFQRLLQRHFLPAAGNRNNNGTVNNVGTNGNYWSSTTASSAAYNLNFNSSRVSPEISNVRGNGFSVRCLAEINTNRKKP